MAESFRRYTNLASLIHILNTKKITLLNPATWDDKNDAYFMSEYKRIENAKTVLALCFAEHSETYHHWRIFAPGSDGVCIEFFKEKLIGKMRPYKELKCREVQYKLINDIKNNSEINVYDLPFLKRKPYKDEKEFRIVYINKIDKTEFKDYDIEIDFIKRITLSPWTPLSLSQSIKTILKNINNCKNLSISKSTLINNSDWKHVTSIFDK